MSGSGSGRAHLAGRLLRQRSVLRRAVGRVRVTSGAGRAPSGQPASGSLRQFSHALSRRTRGHCLRRHRRDGTAAFRATQALRQWRAVLSDVAGCCSRPLPFALCPPPSVLESGAVSVQLCICPAPSQSNCATVRRCLSSPAQCATVRHRLSPAMQLSSAASV